MPKHTVKIVERTRNHVVPIVATIGDSVELDSGGQGRTYYFPDTTLFVNGQDTVVVGAKDKPVTKDIASTAHGVFRYYIWDHAKKDFLEGNSSPIIVVQP